MIRVMALLWISVITIAGLGLYWVKFEVQDIREEVASYETQLEQEKDKIKMLNVEWAYLTRPERIRSLTETHMAMAPTNGQQFVALTTIPEKTTQVAQFGSGLSVAYLMGMSE
jgi:cell division protein FtsL